MAAIGLVLAAAFTWSREAFAYAVAIETPAWLLCGLFVPVAILPDWTHPVSYALAPTWGVDALRRAAEGEPAAGALLACAVLCAASVACAAWLIRIVERRARVDGTLALA